MNLKSLPPILLLAALATLLVACGDAQPPPDIDATVEASVERALAAQPDIDAIVEAKVALALAVIPTPTPIVVVKEVAKEADIGKPVEPEPVLAEDAFADIFQNATRVDRIGLDDIRNCRVESSYDVKVGDIVTVEVALARREDSASYAFSFQPYYSYIRDTSGDGILGNDAERAWHQFSLTSRIIGNPWNEANTGPYVVAVYRGKTSGAFGPGDYAIGEWIPNWGALVPGTYTVGLVKEPDVSTSCRQMQLYIDVENLIPDSVLIAWYVDTDPDLTAEPAPTDSPAPTAAVPARQPGTFGAIVTRVIDGDTVEVLLDDGSTDTVRLLGVDTPETFSSNKPNEYGSITDTACLDRWGIEATNFALELEGQPITLIADPAAGERGSFGRLLAYIEHEGADFNAALVALGLARVYTEGTSSREDSYLVLQELAQALDLGLWKCGSEPSSSSLSISESRDGCDPSYPVVCIPPKPPDLNCGDIAFTVVNQRQWDRSGPERIVVMESQR